MSLGLRDYRRNRRRQRWTAFLKVLLALGLIGAAGAYAYATGLRLAERRVDSLRAEIVTVTSRAQDAERQAQLAWADIAAERQRAQECEQRYQREVPTGDNRELITLVQGKVQAGVDRERIRQVLATMTPARACEAQPKVKRLIVRTPSQAGTSASLPFAVGNLLVSVTGQAARDAKGNPEAWFDSKQPVSARLAVAGAPPLDVNGTLPLTATYLAAASEFKVTIAGAAKGAVQVTAERCRFP